MGKPLVDRLGHRYGRLLVVSRAENYRGNARWNCVCDCGKAVVALGNDLKRGKVKSCGCLNAEQIVKHGLSRSPEYGVWKSMLQRCSNPNDPAYRNYGARGITVSWAWHDFEQFYADVGPRPTRIHSIERKDNSKGYSKENCHWATTVEQLNNKRNNRILEFGGRSMTIGEWAKETGIGWSTIRSRIDRYGWSVERALTEPPQDIGRHKHRRPALGASP